jgi:DNA polymerase IV
MADPQAPRKIIHIDMDCFYAAIEMRDNPALQHLPIAVGGDPNQRGVISTCNYKARAFGVHSAMPTYQALKRCRDLVILPGDMEKYKYVSRAIRTIFFDYTPLVEPLSLDEAYLDVSNVNAHQGSATRIAQAIQQRIHNEQNLTASAGVSSNKLLAKIASDWKKPNGLFVITPEEINTFMPTLPVRKLWGVGHVTANKLHQQGITTCQELAQIPLMRLITLFGSYGQQLYYLCRGIDERQVEPHRVAKSVSVEHTFEQDLQNIPACHTAIAQLLPRLNERLKKKNTKAKTQFLKIKFSDFTQTTVERQFTQLSVETFSKLFEIGYQRKKLPIRLLGIGVHFEPDPPKNASLAIQKEFPI